MAVLHDDDATIYTVTMKGKYYPDDVTQQPKPYEIKDILFTHKELTESNAQSIFKNLLCPEIMVENGFDDYRALKSYDSSQAVYQSGPRRSVTNPDMMGREDLVHFVKNWNDGEGLPVNLLLYTDINELRNACKEAVADPNGFKVRQDEYIEKFGEKILAKQRALIRNGINSTVTQGMEEREVKKTVAAAAKGKAARDKQATDEDY